MAGRIVDLRRDSVLPMGMLLETSIVVGGFVPFARLPSRASQVSQARIAALLSRHAEQEGRSFVAATSFLEAAHLILRTRISGDLSAYPNPISGRPYPSWTRLAKEQPGLFRRHAADIERLRFTLDSAGIEILQPGELPAIPSGRPFEQELIRLIRRYRLDSGDAAILIEASRAGIDAVVSEDPDWRRASRDFDVYTWR